MNSADQLILKAANLLEEQEDVEGALEALHEAVLLSQLAGHTLQLIRAKTFLGDSGSMVMGFLIASFAVDLTQGPGRTFSPICALWVVVIPLCDCVSLMIRRRLAGGSMFAADRQHLHHYLLVRGLSVGQATLVSAGATLVCAVIGLMGWKLRLIGLTGR